MSRAVTLGMPFSQFPGQSQIRLGVVTSIQSPTIGPASGIFYQVSVNTDAGLPEVYDGVQPFNSRPPDEVDTVAAPLGEPVLAVYVSNKVYFLFFGEQFRISECPTEEPGGAT